MDGCGDIRFLTTVVIPISKPLLAVIGLLAAVTSWNSYFYALIFLNSQSLYPLQLVLQQLLVLGNISPSGFSNISPEQLQYFQNLETLLKYSLVVVASVPMLRPVPVRAEVFHQGRPGRLAKGLSVDKGQLKAEKVTISPVPPLAAPAERRTPRNAAALWPPDYRGRGEARAACLAAPSPTC